MLSDDQFQPGRIAGDRVDVTEELDNSETIKAEIVEIDGAASLPKRKMGNNSCFSLKNPWTTSTSVTSWN
jgi:hypothetical protein